MSPSTPIRARRSGPSTPVRGFGVYGGICTMAGVAVQSIDTTPVQINQWTANVPSLEVLPEFNLDRLAIQIPGVYQIFLQMSFTTSGGPATWTGALRINGVEAGNLFWERRVAASGGPGSVSAMVFFELAINDRLTIWVENDTGAFDFGSVQSQFLVFLVSN